MTVGSATVVVAALTWLVLILAARGLGPESYAQFTVFWGLLFAVFGATMGVFNETVRAVAAGAESGSAGSRPVRVSPVIGFAIAGLLGGSAFVWAPVVFADDVAVRAAIVVVGAWLFAILVAVNGVLAGSGNWRLYSAMIGAEAGLRVVLVTSVILLGASVTGLAAAVAGAALVWVPAAIVSRSVRGTHLVRGDVGPSRFARGSLLAMVATSSTAVLVTGFPLLLEITSAAPLGAEGGVLIAAVMITRAPLLIPLGALQGFAIRYFVGFRDRLAVALVRPVLLLGTAVLAVCGVVLVAGPWLMVATFGPEFAVDATTLVLLVLSGGTIAMLTLSGAASLAAGRHVLYAVGWVVATAATAALLLLPGSLTDRAILALTAGPLLGALVHVLGLAAARDRGR